MASTEGAASHVPCALCEDQASRFTNIEVNGQLLALPVCDECFTDIEGASNEHETVEIPLVRLEEDDES